MPKPASARPRPVQPALQHIGPLSPATTYRYRIIATNSDAPSGITGPEHTFTTQETASPLALPDHRGWEMVSPIEKNSGAIQGPGQNFGGDVLQAAAQGGAITYSSASSFGEAAQGAPPRSQYISRRGEGEEGWSTENITTPTVSGSYGSEPDGVPYQLFSPDLARGLLLNGVRCRGGGTGCPVANPPLPGSSCPDRLSGLLPARQRKRWILGAAHRGRHRRTRLGPRTVRTELRRCLS